MRRFIRHPTDIPLHYEVLRIIKRKRPMRNVSHGGLCFKTEHPVTKNTEIHVEINACSPAFAANGTVAWCHAIENGYNIGVEFDESTSPFTLRMVEQICHISHYKNLIWEKEGRNLSSEEAAGEWIVKYAAAFPS